MRTTCLISNFNYRSFVCEAVDSALDQSVPFDEIVVIDDGSEDGSLSHLKEHYRNELRVAVFGKANGGQLSTFNKGFQRTTGEVLFFLDADDRYRRQYVEQALDAYQQHEADFVIAGAANFGCDRLGQRKTAPRRDLGYSTIATLLGNAYVGGPTSALSMRRSIAELVLPYPAESEWRTRADDVLVLASSIVGARKFHLGESLIDYRVHESNHFAGQQSDSVTKLQHAMAVNRLKQWYANKMGYGVESLAPALHREFQTIQRPTLQQWRSYMSISWHTRMPWLVRARHFGETVKHYWSQRLRGLSTPKSNNGEAISPEDLPSSESVARQVA
ncbi:glycosyltransferase family 2 protein [Aeoliella mucimassa]|uniref:Putative glycosyltransferase EpsJ n=1 Tax=Aeoliella mucimassa TaxID=2527972 RepID=A0A518AT62_9BACT|nr:glycosyltransferase family 2 protein [Aeoliella mucimassa]QDU57913.1 putative glycosyltransferase EpsJ [Aeoliella mucimassa]